MGGTASSSLVEVSARDSGVWSSVYVVNIRGGYAAGSIWVATVRPLRADMEVDQVSPFRHTVDMGLLSRFQSGRDLLADLSALNTKHVLGLGSWASGLQSYHPRPASGGRAESRV